MLKIFADGSSLGNPGNSGAGVVVYKNNKIIKKSAFYIGEVTNNFAEYIALILGLQEALVLQEKPVCIYMDSELVTKQIQGLYKVKDKILYPLNALAKNLINIIGDCSIIYKSRLENKLADSLARSAAKSGPVKNTRVQKKKQKDSIDQLTLGL